MHGSILVPCFAILGTSQNSPASLLGRAGTGRWLVHTRVFPHTGLHLGQVIVDV